MALITIPLFALLGGTPFLTFNFSELSYFLPDIYFLAVITLLFWIINISLLLLAAKWHFFVNIFSRSVVSIAAGVLLSACLFYFYMQLNPPPAAPMPPANMKHVTTAGKADTSKMTAVMIPVSPQAPVPGPMDASVENGMIQMMPVPGFFFFPQIIRSLTIDLIILTLCELVFLYFRKQKVEIENARLRQTNLEARNNQLKMQLHPHFLFNSLNTLRLLLKKDAGKAEDYLLKLSEMLRFSTASALHDVVHVEDEVKLCMNYLQMQKVRFGEMLHVVVNNPKVYHANGTLPVYSLQLLAENAIKHNAFTNEMPLVIYIDYNEAEKTITVKNRIQPKRMNEVTTQTGLRNLSERYRLLCNQPVVVLNDRIHFSVTVKILLPNQNASIGIIK